MLIRGWAGLSPPVPFPLPHPHLAPKNFQDLRSPFQNALNEVLAKNILQLPVTSQESFLGAPGFCLDSLGGVPEKPTARDPVDGPRGVKASASPSTPASQEPRNSVPRSGNRCSALAGICKLPLELQWSGVVCRPCRCGALCRLNPAAVCM